MKITKYLDQPVKETPHKIDIRQIYDKESAQVVLMTFKPGESLKPHKTPVDVFFYVLEGCATIHIGEESEECNADSLIESPAHIVHHISNSSENTVRVLVVKAPRPANTTRIL